VAEVEVMRSTGETRMDINPTEIMSTCCIHCGIGIPDPPQPMAQWSDYRCGVCNAIVDSLQTPYFKALQEAENREWLRQVLGKKRLMDGVQ
jgi:hypothetical protein